MADTSFMKPFQVASSALISGAHLMRTSPDVVRRWVNEVQEALNSRFPMVQYHALTLLYRIKQNDRVGISKLITGLTRNSLRSPLAVCQLIRYTTKMLHGDISPTEAQGAYAYLEGCLRHKSEMVIFEAAKSICSLPEVTRRDLAPAITVLQLFLSSPRAVNRFAAVRELNRVSLTHPDAVVRCNGDLEPLIADSNRSIATLAITTLLKTGTEQGVDRLMKDISRFMSDIQVRANESERERERERERASEREKEKDTFENTFFITFDCSLRVGSVACCVVCCVWCGVRLFSFPPYPN